MDSAQTRSTPAPSFLTAQWRDLVMVNYAVDPQLLQPFVPRGTSLDLWHGTAYVSLVAFKFLHTRVLGFPLPGHRNFEEVNLRFYVVREHGGELRRGVVFIKEIVPKAVIAWVARRLYNENYVAVPMRHAGEAQPQASCPVSYEWRMNERWHRVSVVTQGACQLPNPDSEASFIAEHYWGYVRQRNGATVEYQVEHPPWLVDELRECQVAIDPAAVYGEEWKDVLSQTPRSQFLALGSQIRVRRGVPLKDTLPTA